jgi:hypothetical protein
VSSAVPDFDRQDPVRINAWTGAEAGAAPLPKQRAPWALAAAVVRRGRGMRPTPPDLTDWRDPVIGWGVVLPHRPDLDPAALARADDAPEPIRRLVAARPGAKVVRYGAGTRYDNWTLRDYAGGSDLPIATAPTGTGPGCLPSYLLIAASPAEVPWHVQYDLNPVRNVGRLELDDEGLDRYVTALLAEWGDSGADYANPVVWSVDFGGGDITSLMRDAVAEPLYDAFEHDGEMGGARFVDGRASTASNDALADALVAAKPAVVVTTSHGMTGPLDQPDAMARQLGLPVDANRQVLDPATLLQRWQPDGAVWFAHACCSAGSDAPSAYHGLFDPTSLVGEILEGVAKLGALTAPLPRALLGAERPLRAFIGQVEPTFDWTMVFAPTRQRLTSSLRDAVYGELGLGKPAGLALAPVFRPIASLLLGHARALRQYNGSDPGDARIQAVDMALYNKVTAYDRVSTVLLGDPTVCVRLPG